MAGNRNVDRGVVGVSPSEMWLLGSEGVRTLVRLVRCGAQVAGDDGRKACGQVLARIFHVDPGPGRGFLYVIAQREVDEGPPPVLNHRLGPLSRVPDLPSLALPVEFVMDCTVHRRQVVAASHLVDKIPNLRGALLDSRRGRDVRSIYLADPSSGDS